MSVNKKPVAPPVAPPVALTIAGFDPSSGAGITADLKTFAALGTYGICCATALTVQSTEGVQRVVPLEGELVRATLDCLANDIQIAGIKIGMLATATVANAVADFLESGTVPRSSIVLDPVIASSSGAALIDESGLAVLRTRLIKSIGWITPNLEELALLLGEPRTESSGVPDQAQRLREHAADAGNRELRIIVTGGDLDPPNDYFLDSLTAGKGITGEWLTGERIHTSATHGTGCTFSSALLSRWLTGGSQLGARNAVKEAKHYVAGALKHAYPIGRGKGPLSHFFLSAGKASST
jgi:hydroxymethylpyrimidine/phosphomethylpyrimidine kinase